MNKTDYLKQRELWKPKDVIEQRDDETSALIYIYTTREGKPAAMAFHGTRGKADWIFRFQTTRERDDYIARYLATLKEQAKNKAAHKAAKTQYINPWKAGDVLVSTWGYDQTNVDFYQVIKATAKTVTIRPIESEPVPGSEGFMCNMVLPVRGSFKDDMLAPRKVTPWQGGEYIVIGNHTAHKWEGKPVYQSWYA